MSFAKFTSHLILIISAKQLPHFIYTGSEEEKKTFSKLKKLTLPTSNSENEDN